MADYQAIVDAIDVEIAAVLTGPQDFTLEGERLQKRTLTELRETRKMYANLLLTSSGRMGVRMRKISAGGVQ